MNGHIRGLLGLLLLGVLFLPQTVYGQASTTGEIFGTIAEQDGTPITNAQVEATGPQGNWKASTDKNGNFLFQYLPPGAYNLKVQASGYRITSMKGIDVRLDTRTRADVTVQEGDEVEIIEITGSAVPVIDTTKISVSTELTSDLLQRIPIGRSISSSMSLAAGVADAGDPVLQGNPSISGSSGLENSYIVDGVDITNAGYGSLGAYSIRYGSMGSGVNFDFVEMIQVKTAGFEAEYGSALGGVVNVITKRGTNELKGSFFSYLQPLSFEAPRRLVSLRTGNANVVGYEEWDVGVTVGGPLIKDKLFFFAAINPQMKKTIRRVADSDPDGDGNIDFPLGDRDWDTERSQQAYAGSLTWKVAPGHVLDVSVFGDPGRSEQGPQSGGDILTANTSRFSEIGLGGHNQVLRYSGTLTDWMSVEAQVARAQIDYSQGFPARNDQRSITDYTPVDSGGAILRSGGLGYYEKEMESVRTQYQVKISNYFNALGRHEVKYGIAYEDIQFNDTRARTGEPLTFWDPNEEEFLTTESGVSISRIFADAPYDTTVINRIVRGYVGGSAAETRSDYISVFLQDQWNPIEDLTISLGIRAEHQRLIGSARDYVFNLSDNLAPRLGITYDFTGEGRGKVYAHFGRFYEKIPNDLAVRLFSQEDSVTRVDFVDYNGNGILELDEQLPNYDEDDPDKITVNESPTHYNRVGGEPSEVRDGTKSQYQDELVLGVEYELFDEFNVGLRWIHREIGRVLEDFQLSTSEGINAGREDFGAYVVGNPGSNLNNECPPGHPNCWVDPERKYDALELTIEKRFSNGWQVNAWYRLSQLWGNYEGLFRNDNGQSDPNLTSLFDFPNNTNYNAGEIEDLCGASPTQECIANLPAPMELQGKSGFLNTNRTHLFRIAGSYSTEGGLTVGGVAWFQTGTPITGLRVHPVYENSGEVPIDKRGSFGTTPLTYGLDLHLHYDLDIGDGFRAVASVDVFNVLNSQEIVQVDQEYEVAANTLNPDFLRQIRYQLPRQVRFGLKLVF